MKWFKQRRKEERAKRPANRALTEAELLARQAQAEAKEAQDAKQAMASAKTAPQANSASGSNRLRTSEEFRAEQREKQRAKRRRDNQIGGLVREVLSGEILAREALVRQVPFLLFVSFLTILYLALGYQTERILREKQRTQDLLEEAIAVEKTLRSDFESQLQQSQLERSTAALGLEQPNSPPIVIRAEE